MTASMLSASDSAQNAAGRQKKNVRIFRESMGSPEDAVGPLYNGRVIGMLNSTRVLIALGTIVIPLSAQKASKDTVEQGRKEFEKACGFCHGADATGARAPDLIRSTLVSNDHNGDQLGPLIRNGRPDKGMPPLPMSDAQVTQIAAFLQARVDQAMASNKQLK